MNNYCLLLFFIILSSSCGSWRKIVTEESDVNPSLEKCVFDLDEYASNRANEVIICENIHDYLTYERGYDGLDPALQFSSTQAVYIEDIGSHETYYTGYSLVKCPVQVCDQYKSDSIILMENQNQEYSPILLIWYLDEEAPNGEWASLSAIQLALVQFDETQFELIEYLDLLLSEKDETNFVQEKQEIRHAFDQVYNSAPLWAESRFYDCSHVWERIRSNNIDSKCELIKTFQK